MTTTLILRAYQVSSSQGIPYLKSYLYFSDMRWGNFESFGFGGSDDTKKKLEFDLTEGARQVGPRAQYCRTRLTLSSPGSYQEAGDAELE